MTHELVREAVERIEVGAKAPASGVIDAGLAELALENLLPHGNPEATRRQYGYWAPFHSGKLRVHPDIQSATLAATSSARGWAPYTHLGTIYGALGEERDRAVRESREAINRLLNPTVDRAALDLGQRFKRHTQAPHHGDWHNGPRSWLLVSELTANAVAYAVGTSLARVAGDLSSRDAARVATGLLLLQQAGVWAFRANQDGGVDCVPKPTITLNLADEPHSDGAPAIQWPDAQEVWAFNGQIVPRAWIVEPERITRERFERTNSLPMTEVMLEIYGIERYVQESGEVLTEDEVGKLWHAAHPWQSSATWGALPVNLRVVEVLNSTPEPDGAVRTYWLRVPGTTRRPREGVAWTFDVREHDYQPTVET